MRKNNMKTIEEKLEMINRYKSGESATKIVKENAINKRRTNWESNYFAYRPRFCLFKYKTYNNLLNDFNIQRSMSQTGTPTDNPVNESLNGWIKEESFIDFDFGHAKMYQI